MAKKYYAVKKGRETGIFYTWDECRNLTQGFSGAVFKSFENIEDAKRFLSDDIVNFKVKSSKPKEVKKEINCIESSKKCKNSNNVLVYVDGSYEDSIKNYGSGVVILKNDEVIKTFSIRGNDKDLVSMRNVSGEIEASKIAMIYCIENKIEEIDLYFDYEGIEHWLTGRWQTKKEGTKKYKKFYDSIKDELKVNFVKVKAHSGDKYNDMADILAKQSLGII